MNFLKSNMFKHGSFIRSWSVAPITPVFTPRMILKRDIHNKIFISNANNKKSVLQYRLMSTNSAAEEPQDFLSKHGGKVALIGFAVAIGLITQYFLGIRDRNKTEDNIDNELYLDPYEINEIRDCNMMSLDVYHSILSKAVSASYKISNDSNNSSLKSNQMGMTYKEFIQIVLSETSIQRGYLLDRVILRCSENNEPVPLSILMCVLSLTLSSHLPGPRRAFALFSLCRSMSNYEATGVEPTILSENGTETPMVTMDAMIELLDGLLLTCQIPTEKLVIETGVTMPYKTHRKKTSIDLVNTYKKSTKPPLQEDLKGLTFEQFHDMLLGGSVCIWGSCYKGSQ